MTMPDESGALSLRERLTRIEGKLDDLDLQLERLSGRVAGLVDRQTLDRHDQRIRELEKMADRYVPDPATMLQRRQDWEKMRTQLNALESVANYRRWLIGIAVGYALEAAGVVAALYGAFHH